MINIYTITENRTEIVEVWYRALKATLKTPFTTTVLYQTQEPKNCGAAYKIPHLRSLSIQWALKNIIPDTGVTLFLEEDMIPVIPWTIDDYPGNLLFAEGSNGCPWFALTLRRNYGKIGHIEPGSYSLVQQRFIHEGGCPEWVPDHLKQLATKAYSKVLGNHFLHLDKMYASYISNELKEAKNELLQALKNQFIING